MKADDWYQKGVEGLYREGEEEIVNDAYYSYLYACNKLKDRFKAYEESADKFNIYWSWYIRVFEERKGIKIE